MSVLLVQVLAPCLYLLVWSGLVPMAAPLTENDKVLRLEPDFRFLLADEEGVPLACLAQLYDLGYTSIKLFAKFDSDEAAVKAGIDTDMGLKASDGPVQRATVAKLLSAWETCRQRVVTKQKIDADAAVNATAKVWARPEHITLLNTFHSQEGYELKDHLAPAPAYLEKRADEFEQGELVTETLAQVISKDVVEDESMNAIVVKDGSIKFKKGGQEVPMPSKPEELRQRLKVWGHHWILLKYKFPQQHRLASATGHLFNTYIDYLLGDEVYELVAKDSAGKTVSKPSFPTLLGYEFRVRKKMTEHMNKGDDIKTALVKAMHDSVVKERFYTTPIAMSAVTSGNRDRSRSPAREKDTRLPWMRGEIQSVGDKGGKGGDKGGKRKKVKKGKGGDKAKKGNLYTKTPDGKGICFRYNDQNQKCRGSTCNFTHVCSFCLGKHPLHMCTQQSYY